MPTILQQTIGRGVLYPIKLTAKYPELAADEYSDNYIPAGDPENPLGWYPTGMGDSDLIHNNLIHIFMEQVGMRLRNEFMGTELQEYIEEPFLEMMMFKLRNHLYDVVTTFEPRVSEIRIASIQQTPGQLKFSIQLMVDGTMPVVVPMFFDLVNLQVGIGLRPYKEPVPPPPATTFKVEPIELLFGSNEINLNKTVRISGGLSPYFVEPLLSSDKSGNFVLTFYPNDIEFSVKPTSVINFGVPSGLQWYRVKDSSNPVHSVLVKAIQTSPGFHRALFGTTQGNVLVYDLKKAI
jgi:phage baseplate assembly protein W